jgi:hypothetical protein
MRLVRTISLFAFMTSMSAPALAQYVVEVAAGKRTGIGTVGVFDVETCHSAGGNPRVTKPPAHGKVELAKVQVRNTTRTAACIGTVLDVVGVYYTPRAGFRGSDSLQVTMDVHNGSVDVPEIVTYTITVK